MTTPTSKAEVSMILDVDAGEHDDEPVELWQLADLVNVACGGHAGDAASMARVVAATRARIGAHPSYPDRDGFGRRTIAIAPDALAASIEAQCRALAAHARVEAIKPHGALYHDANKQPELAAAVARVAASLGASLVGPPAGAMRDAAIAHGVAYVREGFADRGMRPDGSLVPRNEPGALISDPAAAAARVRELAGRVDAICVHADTPNALAIARAVRAAIDAL